MFTILEEKNDNKYHGKILKMGNKCMMPFEKDSYKWQIGHKQKTIEQYKETHKGELTSQRNDDTSNDYIR